MKRFAAIKFRQDSAMPECNKKHAHLFFFDVKFTKNLFLPAVKRILIFAAMFWSIWKKKTLNEAQPESHHILFKFLAENSKVLVLYPLSVAFPCSSKWNRSWRGTVRDRRWMSNKIAGDIGRRGLPRSLWIVKDAFGIAMCVHKGSTSKGMAAK